MTPSAAETAQIEAVALNGAQVTSAQGIIQAVAAGQLPRQTAVNMLVAFFGMKPETVDRVVGEVGRSFSPAPSEPDPK